MEEEKKKEWEIFIGRGALICDIVFWLLRVKEYVAPNEEAYE